MELLMEQPDKNVLIGSMVSQLLFINLHSLILYLVSLAATIWVVTREVLRDDPYNSCEGDYSSIEFASF